MQRKETRSCHILREKSFNPKGVKVKMISCLRSSILQIPNIRRACFESILLPTQDAHITPFFMISTPLSLSPISLFSPLPSSFSLLPAPSLSTFSFSCSRTHAANAIGSYDQMYNTPILCYQYPFSPYFLNGGDPTNSK